MVKSAIVTSVRHSTTLGQRSWRRAGWPTATTRCRTRSMPGAPYARAGLRSLMPDFAGDLGTVSCHGRSRRRERGNDHFAPGDPGGRQVQTCLDRVRVGQHRRGVPGIEDPPVGSRPGAVCLQRSRHVIRMPVQIRAQDRHARADKEWHGSPPLCRTRSGVRRAPRDDLRLVRRGVDAYAHVLITGKE